MKMGDIVRKIDNADGSKKENNFATLNARDTLVKKARVIAATEDMKIYDLVEDAIRFRYPQYFGIKV